jgi:hypothetical protein
VLDESPETRHIFAARMGARIRMEATKMLADAQDGLFGVAKPGQSPAQNR